MFSSKEWNEGTNKAVMGKTLNKATLSKIKVTIPDIETQKKLWLKCAEYALSDFIYQKNERTGRNEKIKLNDGIK